jgi:hypothetical protein
VVDGLRPTRRKPAQKRLAVDHPERLSGGRTAEIIVAKHRNGPMTAKVRLAFLKGGRSARHLVQMTVLPSAQAVVLPVSQTS